MQAELKGKIPDRSEDRLTGNFFGTLRYLPFDKGLGPVLTGGTCPPETARALGEHLPLELTDSWANNIHFWKHFEEGEPDILLEFDNAVAVIEVKLDSGLSSDDETGDPEDDQKLPQDSKNQLARYAGLLKRIAKGREMFLLLLAPQSSANTIYTDVKRRKIIAEDLRFGYITWQKALDILESAEGRISDPFEKLIITDLCDLLELKGLGGFRDFKISAEVDANDVWNFTPRPDCWL
ncbi:MAG: PD-(D/E)XK nuclease family protein [Gracilibacteraceae bacterium]|nr:PD-(D/E)XK nuclease family protein [Gracilibacteraceae bacterium]